MIVLIYMFGVVLCSRNATIINSLSLSNVDVVGDNGICSR